MTRELGAHADENRFLPAADLDRIVGHEPVAADDQVERALALPDAAFAGDEHAETEHVHQHGVHHRAIGQRIFENRRQLRDRRWRRDRGPDERQTRVLGFGHELGRRSEPPGDDDARKIERERQTERRDARRRVQPFEVADLALPENQDASGPEVFVEARECEARLLDVRARDAAVEAGGAGQQLERQPERLGV